MTCWTHSRTACRAAAILSAALLFGAANGTAIAQPAQDPGGHDHSADHKPAEGEHGRGAQHGGQFVETTDHHGVEMVASAAALFFYLTEEHKPMDLTGGTFKAIVQADGATKILPLTAEDGRLSAPLDAPLPKGAIVAFTGKDGHGHTIQARLVKE